MFKARRLRKVQAELQKVISTYEVKLGTLDNEIKRLSREAASKPKSLQAGLEAIIATKLKLYKLEQSKLRMTMGQQAMVEMKRDTSFSQNDIARLNAKLGKLVLGEPGEMSQAVNEMFAQIEEQTGLYEDELADISVNSSSGESLDEDAKEARQLIALEEQAQRAERENAIAARVAKAKPSLDEWEIVSDESEENAARRRESQERE